MISIVVPTFNTEKYLGSCLDSLVSQNVEKEIIVIDDGSSDNSLSIAKIYAKKYPFVSVYHQENKGQSCARNVGIRKAKGDYIFFCDSDDYIENNSLAKLEEICIKNDLDMIFTGWETINQSGKSFSNIPKRIELNKVLKSDEYFAQSIKNWYNVVPWNGLVRRKHLVKNSLFFPEGIQFEDNYFHLILLLIDLNAKVMQTDMLFYKVRIADNSTTTSFPSPKKVYDQLANISLMRDFIKNKGFDGKMHRASMKAVSSLVFTMTSYFYRIEKKYRKEIYKAIPRKYLNDSIRYSASAFQKAKLFMFTYLRFALDFYEFLRKKI